jgi:uncharacterized protein (UPF0548 family)
MFHFARPDAATIRLQIEAASAGPSGSPRLLSLDSGLAHLILPFAFAHDRRRSCIGRGEAAFVQARRAFSNWEEFDLGWVRVANPQISMVAGQIVAVEVRAFGLWSLNLSRIVETVDTATRFGFLYATTPYHAEEGEERFLLEFDPNESQVWYELEAVSRPRHPLARLAYPVTRGLQHRFARDSHQRMHS